MTSTVEIFAMMQAGRPYKAFKKVVPAIVRVIILDPFDTKKPQMFYLKGEGEDSWVQLWSEEEYLFFKRANKIAIKNGRIVEKEYPVEGAEEKSPNEFTDEEIDALVESKFLKLRTAVDKVTSEATMHRFVKAGEAKERPEATMTYLRERLSAVQSGQLLDED